MENPRGVGEVFDKDRLVVLVAYNLEVVQEEPLEGPSSVGTDVSIFQSASGSITVIEKGKKLHGTKKMTLYLKDNRKLDFVWQKAHPYHPKYSIRSCGDFSDLT